VFKELVERLAQDVESGSVKWKWNSSEDTASQSSPASCSPRQPGKGIQGGEDYESGQRSLTDPSQVPPRTSCEPGAEESAPKDEQALKHIAGPVIDDSSRQVTDGSPAEVAAQEPILIYEISADEFPPAEVELAEDYSEPPEASEPRVPVKPERIDGAPLPYEGRAEGKQLRLPRMD
jgi:hypothetical protein